MAIQTVADLVARSTTSSPTVTSNQYRSERDDVLASIGLENKAIPPVAAVSSNPPKMYFDQAQTSIPEAKPQGQGQALSSGSNVAPPRTDYATGISEAERSRTGMGRQVSSEDRTNDVLGLVRQGLSDPLELQRYLNVNQAGSLASGYTEAEIARIIKENQNAVAEGQQYRQQAVAGGATPLSLEEQAQKTIAGTLAKREERFNAQQDYLNKQFDRESQATSAEQRSETGTANLQLARMGAFTAASGVDYGFKMSERHRNELGALEDKRRQALSAAQDAYDEDSLAIAYKQLENARAAKKDAADAKAAQLEEMMKYEQLRKFEKDNASDFFKGLAAGGMSLDDLPEDYLAEKFPNMDKGDALTLYSTHKLEQDSKKIDEQLKQMTLQEKKLEMEDKPLERQKMLMDIQASAQNFARNTLDQTAKLQEVMAKWPKGVPLQIGDASFMGIEGGAIFEASGDGVGRLLYKDPVTGKNAVMNMEFVGDPADMTTVYENGLPILVNKKTGAQAPITRGVPGQQPDAAIKWEKYFPQGADGGQCGEFVHNLVTNYPYGANTIEEKKKLVNVAKGSVPRMGDVIVQDLNTDYGHVGVVNWIGPGANGQTMVRLTESNYAGPEKVSHTRLVPITDPSIAGYFRGTLKPGLEVGTDIPTTNQAPETTPTEQPTQELTFSASPFTTGRLTEAQFNAANEKEQSAREAAMLVSDKTSTFEEATKGLPAAVINRTKRILEENKVGTKPVTQTLAPQPYAPWVKQREQELGQSLKPEVAKEQYAEYQKEQNSVKTVVDAIGRGKYTNKEQRAEFNQQAQELVAAGDFKGLEDLANQVARNSMSQKQQELYSAANNLASSYETGIDLLSGYANDPTFSSGNLKSILEKAKKKTGVTADPRLTELEQLLGTFQSPYRASLYGASLTDNEIAEANKTIINLAIDTPETAWNKMKTGIALHKFASDVALAEALGTKRPVLKDYLSK